MAVAFVAADGSSPLSKRTTLIMLMKLTLLKSKIHRATVTAASLHYEGSLTISAALAALVQLREYEKILVGNLRNGERFETYVIYGSPRKGLNSAKRRHSAPRHDRRSHHDHEFCALLARRSRPPSAADHCPRREESGCSQGRRSAPSLKVDQTLSFNDSD